VKHGTKHAAGLSLGVLVGAVALVSLLAGVVIPVVANGSDDARATRAIADLEVLSKAFWAFRTHTNAWPGPNAPVGATSVATADADLATYRCLYSNADNLAGWKGPYLDQGALVNKAMQVAVTASARQAGNGFLDPWGQPYRVFTFGPGDRHAGAVIILSRGPDGIVNSSSNDVKTGAPAGDDIIKVVSAGYDCSPK
jgi:type II secretory pathway pseudopilin PulG